MPTQKLHSALLLLGLCAPSLMQAQGAPPAAVAGPSLGYIYDPITAKLRPLVGIPGAAALGPALDLGADISAAVVSPRQDYAVVTIAAGASLAVARLGRGGLKVVQVEGLDAGPDSISLSPTGSAAAFYYRAANIIRIVSGLPDSPAVSASIDSSQLPSQPAAVAIGDDAISLLVAVNTDSGGAAYLFAGGNLSQAYAGGRVSAVAFAPLSASAVVADSASNSIFSLSGPAPALLAGAADGIASPVALFSNGSQVFVGNSDTQSVTVLDMTGSRNPPVTVGCQCAPSAFHPLAGKAVFRLTEVSGDPISVFEGDRLGGRVVLIPTGSAAQ